MRKAPTAVLLIASLVCGSAVWCAARGTPNTTSPKSELMKVLSHAASAVREKTALPLRLPTHIAGLDDAGKGDIYAIVESADETGYSIMLAAEPECGGEHRCSYGRVSGRIGLFSENYDARRKRTQVALAHGIKAYFYDTVCGAYCDESWISWKEGKYHYAIALKAGSKRDLVKAANSAIRAGAERWK